MALVEGEIIVKRRTVGGRKAFEPDNELGKRILQLSRTHRGVRVVFMPNELDNLRDMGFTIKILEPRIVYE